MICGAPPMKLWNPKVMQQTSTLPWIHHFQIFLNMLKYNSILWRLHQHQAKNPSSYTISITLKEEKHSYHYQRKISSYTCTQKRTYQLIYRIICSFTTSKIKEDTCVLNCGTHPTTLRQYCGCEGHRINVWQLWCCKTLK